MLLVCVYAQKHISTFIHPSRLPYQDAYYFDGCAGFISSYATYQPLDPPTEFVSWKKCWWSSTSILADAIAFSLLVLAFYAVAPAFTIFGTHSYFLLFLLIAQNPSSPDDNSPQAVGQLLWNVHGAVLAVNWCGLWCLLCCWICR